MKWFTRNLRVSQAARVQVPASPSASRLPLATPPAWFRRGGVVCLGFTLAALLGVACSKSERTPGNTKDTAPATSAQAPALAASVPAPGATMQAGTDDGRTPGLEHAALAYPAIEPADAARGPALVERFECNRCHAETGGKPAERPKDCVGCHDDIVHGRFPAPAEALARWKKTSDPYTVTPSLLDVGRRLRRDWLVHFLQQPGDLRPQLAASMPRLELSEQDARDLAAYLTRGATPGVPLPKGNAQRGKALSDEKRCGGCHAFTGASGFVASFDVGDERQKRAVRLAPDLRHTRERFLPEALVAWLQDPVALKADSLMPNHGLSKLQATDVAAYLLETPLAVAPPASLPARLPVLERRVSYQEVDEKVFRLTCRHCHSDPDASMGDGGPGNTGGFGFAPKQLDLATYRGIAAGYVDAKGERQSVFAPMEDGVPRLLATLLARQAEHTGVHRRDLRGMPLGLPQLSSEQVQLVESWIAQGRPR